MWILFVGSMIVVVTVIGFLAVSLILSRSREDALSQALEILQRSTHDLELTAGRAMSEKASTVNAWERFWAGGPIAHSMKKVLEILEGYALDDKTAPKPFSKRLAEENGWDEAFTAAAIVEYKRFLALYVTTGITVTPSKVVDEVWHLHLQYTQNYWALCRELGVAINHCPSRGDEVDETKYQQAFVRTLACYKAVFLTNPPTAIWGEIPAAVDELLAQQQQKADTLIAEEKKKRGRRNSAYNPYTKTGSSGSDNDGSTFLYNFLLWHTIASSPSSAAASSGDSSSPSPSVGIPMNESSSAPIASCGGSSSSGGTSSYSSDSGSSYGGSSYGGGFSSCGGSSGGGFSSCGGGGGGGASCGGGGM